MTQLNTLKDNKGARTVPKLLGRGIGSGLGKTCGKGHKGQKARSGGQALNGFEGGQNPIYRRLPKRGFNSHAPRCYVLNFQRLDSMMKNGLDVSDGEISLSLLKAQGFVQFYYERIRLVDSNGSVPALTFKVTGASKTATDKVTKAKGKIEILTSAPKVKAATA
jgi:large subunit ribosomal protein L15